MAVRQLWYFNVLNLLAPFLLSNIHERGLTVVAAMLSCNEHRQRMTQDRSIASMWCSPHASRHRKAGLVQLLSWTCPHMRLHGATRRHYQRDDAKFLTCRSAETSSCEIKPITIRTRRTRLAMFTSFPRSEYFSCTNEIRKLVKNKRKCV